MGIALFVFYTSSRPLTGVAPFQDLTLSIGAVSALIAFCWYERRHTEPFVNPALFRNRDFSFAAVCVSIHIMLMGGVGFVIPLMVTDLYAFSAPQAGALLTLHAGAPLITMRLGGRIVDRLRSRIQIVLGLTIEGIAMAILALLPADGSLVPLLITALILHGLKGGLCLAALHLFAQGNVQEDQTATAAGLCSMVCFTGSMIGPAVGGVLFYLGTERFGIASVSSLPLTAPPLPST